MRIKIIVFYYLFFSMNKYLNDEYYFTINSYGWKKYDIINRDFFGLRNWERIDFNIKKKRRDKFNPIYCQLEQFNKNVMN